ncbi:MAG TPA: cytochrome c maturation protein CcmE [Thermoanaerobaculia bacterium]|nr:cytochrome c maturation protein CcmE [Thermoanaerobaculia bacterium]
MTAPADRSIDGSTLRNRRLLALGAVVLAGGAFAYLATGDLGENLVFYWSPTELVEAGAKAETAAIRLGGLVVADSIVYGEDGLTLDFEVTDGKTTVPVSAQTVPPAMFRAGIGVVLEGNMQADGRFHTTRLMVKHDNEYRAPHEVDERSMEELVKSLQFDRTDT